MYMIKNDKNDKNDALALWRRDQPSPECLYGVGCGNALWKAVPQSGTRGKEGVPVDVNSAEWDQELQ